MAGVMREPKTESTTKKPTAPTDTSRALPSDTKKKNGRVRARLPSKEPFSPETIFRRGERHFTFHKIHDIPHCLFSDRVRLRENHPERKKNYIINGVRIWLLRSQARNAGAKSRQRKGRKGNKPKLSLGFSGGKFSTFSH